MEGRLVEAERCYRHVLERWPRHFDALHMMGVLAIQQRRPVRAIELLSKALKQNSQSPAVHRNLAVAQKLSGELVAAVKSYQRALAIQPYHADTHLKVANTLIELGRPLEALEHCEQAIAQQPADAAVYLLQAMAHRTMQAPEKALASCDVAIAVRPDSPAAWDKRGAALQDLARPAEALLSCERAIQLREDFALAQSHAGLICLQMGQFERGWRLSERRDRSSAAVRADDLNIPRWTGEQPLAGSRLWVTAEQGLGDTLQFCRYADLLNARGAQVTLAVQPAVRAIVSSLGPHIRVVPDTDSPLDVDLHSPLLSLPHAFNTVPETIPTAIPYLYAQPDRVSHWRQLLGCSDFKIGVSWQSSTAAAAVGKSFPLAELHALSNTNGVRLISLQKGHGTGQLDSLPPGMRIETLGEGFDSGMDAFLDTAAVMQIMDLIVTCDTSVAHLAGALGRPTWIALKYSPDWRWMLDRSDSPWYPSVRLFRQKRSGDWQSVFEAMFEEISRVIAELGLGKY